MPNIENHSSFTEISVAKSPQEFELIAKVEPVLKSIGYGLWDLEIAGSRSPTIRISLEGPNGAEIGIEDCSRVHEELGPMFDVWDPVEGAYTLEVSSPGEKANLRTLKQFQLAQGDRIRCQTIDSVPMPPPAKPRKNWEGVLVSVDETTGDLSLVDSLGTHLLKLKQIRLAQWLRGWTTETTASEKTKIGEM